MVKQLLSPPLQQAMLLVWVAGLLRISDWLNHAHPTWGWVFAAALSAMTLALIAGLFRKPGILPACVVLGLVAIVALAERVGIGDLTTLATVAALYAMLAWRITILASNKPLTTRLVRLLALRGGYGDEGGRRTVERVVHWSCFSLISLALTGSALLNAMPGVIPFPEWPILVLGILFMWLSAQRYRLRLHAYLLIAIGAWAIVGVYAQALIGGQPTLLFHHPWLGFVLALYSLGVLAVSSWLAGKNVDAADQGQSTAVLYVVPLRVSAVAIAALAVLQTLALVLVDAIAAPGWSGMLTLASSSGVLLAAAGMLARPYLSHPGAALALMSITWGYGAAVHGMLPLGLWPTGPASGDQWLVLVLTALAFAVMALRLNRHRLWHELYGWALFRVAWLAYGWSTVGALGLMIQSRPHSPWVFAALIAGSFPLFRPMVEGVRMRGLAVALLVSVFVASLIDPVQSLPRAVPLAMLWAYGLWLAGNLVLPSLNARFPQWAVANETWPWLGLLTLIAGLLWGISQGMAQSLAIWGMILPFAGYSFLMLCSSAWPGFTWLAVFALTVAGVAFAVDRHQSGLLSFEIGAVGLFAVEILILANLLLAGASLWQRLGPRFSTRLGLRQHELRLPLLAASLVLCLLWLLALGLWDAALILMPDTFPNNRSLAVLLGCLLSLSFLHVLWLWSSVTAAQLLIWSAFFTVLSAWTAFHYFQLPLALALWGMLTVALSLIMARVRDGIMNLLYRALMRWEAIIPLMVLILLVLDTDVSIAERMTTLGVVSGIAAVQGLRLGNRRWLFGAATMLVVLLHGIWLRWVPWIDASYLLPWYALQFAVITWGLRRLRQYIEDRGSESISTGKQALALVGEVITSITPLIGALAILEWLMHALSVVESLLSATDPFGYGGAWSALSALVAAGVLIAVGIGEARHAQRPAWVYGVAMMIAAAAVYGRLLWVGLAPPNLWDTVALMTAAYLLFILQRMTLSRPILNTMMVMPMLALMTVPFQLGSAQAGLTLLAAATLYLLTRHATGMRTPMYLGLLALNGSIYLWVPGWAQHYGLFQVYLIPAALSVLLLLHLHRRELKARVLNGVRLVALCTLYAAATLDVFIQEQLMVFVLALVLSIAGIILGIGLRTRAFLYAGVTFLVLNVLGQLLQFYPEQGLGRALLLMGLGSAITGMMIWFNIKREVIMERVRIFRADLQAWD